MTHTVTDACIECKYTDCVEVCPVECFHEGENMVVINPDLCIDCGVCIPECPAEAIIPDTAEGAENWVKLNRELSQTWPQATEPRPPRPEAEKWKSVPDKLSYLKK